jgi:DNA-binding NtrC family response regulator
VIPSLRDRASDIPLIARHLIHRASVALGTSEPVLSNAALDRLIEHTWPGNVRELENCVMRAVVLSAGAVIRPEHLSIASPRSANESSLASLSELERQHIARVLTATDGHKTRAAELLGVTRARLNRLIEKYGIA